MGHKYATSLKVHKTSPKNFTQTGVNHGLSGMFLGHFYIYWTADSREADRKQGVREDLDMPMMTDG